MISNYEIILRIGIACILGGIIGIEREKNRHPAGFRTHILVCIGAALVMLCNIYLLEKYRGYTNVDPARLGAQVISGLGFLGAGTIIKEGISVKGLTTAASLWAVGCIGIAVGIGFYTGAGITTAFVLIALIIFSRFEHTLYGKNYKYCLVIKAERDKGVLDKITQALESLDIYIISLSSDVKDKYVKIIVKTVNKKNKGATEIIGIINDIEGIFSIKLCE